MDMSPGLIGGIIGAVLGIAGGVIGTAFSIKKTKGPLEKAFMIKASIVSWLLCLVMLALLILLPSPYNMFMWGPYAIIMPFGIRHMNRRLSALREEDAKNNPGPEADPEL